MKVALDAMGGDHAPQVPVEGALSALDELKEDFQIVLVGRRNEIEPLLDKSGRLGDPRVTVFDTPDVVTMNDSAGRALREKPDSSLLKAVDLHAQHEVDAVISAGHTGVQMAASYMKLGLIEGVRRPTIGTIFPVGTGKFSILLDVGANTDCKPINLLQFAVMGSVYIEMMTGIQNPRVALLSIGTEKSKGNELILAAYYLLENSGLNFIGNLEGGDLLTGSADVFVCDGFVGNVVLKLLESIHTVLFARFKSLGNGHTDSPEMNQLKRELDYAEIGGVPLLGINGISVICHGGSSTKAIKNAIREAVTLAKRDLQKALSDRIDMYDAGFFARGIARFKGFHEKRDQLDVENNDND